MKYNMTQEDKQLLLQDLCTRLPYGVKCRYQHAQYVENGKIIDISMSGRVNIDGHIKDICDIKPYLFPLESMTEEQKEEHQDLIKNCYDFDANENVFILQNFYNKNHLDNRGLIKKDLAIDCTNLNIY